MDCDQFFNLSNNWNEKVCIFGAGECGSTWGYDLICKAGYKVDFYCDNNKKGSVNGLTIYEPDKIYNKSNVLCFVAVGGSNGKKIVLQLKDHGCSNIIWIDKPQNIILAEVAEYIDKSDDYGLKDLFSELLDDEWFINKIFKEIRGKNVDFSNPQTLNEKIQYLKVYNQQKIYSTLCDKYAIREYIGNKFGEEYLVPLIFKTSDYKALIPDNILSDRFVIKANAWSGDVEIIRDKSKVDWKRIQEKYKYILEHNWYYRGREWGYKNVVSSIVVEKLLETKEGHIPNDYKLHFFNGKLEFIYCAIDREKNNYRKIYDEKWNPLNFAWFSPNEGLERTIGPDIECPSTFDKMKEIGCEVSKIAPYVRVDFYDVDGRLYCGEVTLYHGSGFDRFDPVEYDYFYGKKLDISEVFKDERL